MRCVNKDCYLNGSIERHTKVHLQDANDTVVINSQYKKRKSNCRKFDELEIRTKCACVQWVDE